MQVGQNDLSMDDKVKAIKHVIDKVDPIGLLKLGSPKDEYQQEALMLANKVAGFRITWKQVESVFKEQFDKTLSKKVCRLIALNITSELQYIDFFDDFKQNELLKDKVTLQNGAIVLKVHDNFIIESFCGKTYINDKFYFDIEDQDLLDSLCRFVTDDKTVYVQYYHKHLGLHFEYPFRYFKEIKKSKFLFEKLKHRNDIELAFDNKQVIYTANSVKTVKDCLPNIAEQQIVELMYIKPIDGKYEKVLFSPDKRKRILIYKENNVYSYGMEKLTILDDHERKYAQCYAIWEPGWGGSGISLYDSLEHLLVDIAPQIVGWKERE